MLVLRHVRVQTRQQSICVRHEDVVDNTTTWLMDFQEQFGLATKPGFPIEVLRPALLKHIGIQKSEFLGIFAHLGRRRWLTISINYVTACNHTQGLCLYCCEGPACRPIRTA